MGRGGGGDSSRHLCSLFQAHALVKARHSASVSAAGCGCSGCCCGGSCTAPCCLVLAAVGCWSCCGRDVVCLLLLSGLFATLWLLNGLPLTFWRLLAGAASAPAAADPMLPARCNRMTSGAATPLTGSQNTGRRRAVCRRVQGERYALAALPPGCGSDTPPGERQTNCRSNSILTSDNFMRTDQSTLPQHNSGTTAGAAGQPPSSARGSWRPMPAAPSLFQAESVSERLACPRARACESAAAFFSGRR